MAKKPAHLDISPDEQHLLDVELDPSNLRDFEIAPGKRLRDATKAEVIECAKKYEKLDPETGQRYTWSQRESLEELASPERLVQIRQKASSKPQSDTLVSVLDDEVEGEEACAICSV